MANFKDNFNLIWFIHNNLRSNFFCSLIFGCWPKTPGETWQLWFCLSVCRYYLLCNIKYIYTHFCIPCPLSYIPTVLTNLLNLLLCLHYFLTNIYFYFQYGCNAGAPVQVEAGHGCGQLHQEGEPCWGGGGLPWWPTTIPTSLGSCWLCTDEEHCRRLAYSP